MNSNALPARSEVPEASTWDLASIFATAADWDAAAASLVSRLAELAADAGHLTESGPGLLDWLRRSEVVDVALGQLVVYASMCFDTDTTDPAHAARWQRAQGLVADSAAAIAFEVPELLAAGRARLDALMAETPALAVYAHRFDNILRRAAHFRGAEVEEVLALSTDPLWSFYSARGSLLDADLRFGAVDAGSAALPISEGTVHGLMEHADRAVRQAAWELYADGYLSVGNTVTALLSGHVKGTTFQARVRRYPTVRAMALDAQCLPEVVYQNVLDAFKEHIGVWQHYFDVRRRALGLDVLAPYDMWAPLVPQTPTVAYDEACRWIVEGMAPLGAEYVTPLERGLSQERWVDVYPNRGKRGGAYSGGAYGTYPFIMLNYTGSYTDMSVLAHELGHSMHSYFARAQQPAIYADYGIFVAEVASNFNQAVVRSHLLAKNTDADFQIAVLCEALANFYRYFFLMPVLALFEDEMYRKVEAGGGLTQEGLSDSMRQLLQAAFSDAVAADPARLGMLWAQFPHLYMDYYVFQYATGIAAAHTLAADVVAGVPGAAERYLDFLKTGGSRYPLDALAVAGVDMTSRAPLDTAFEVLAGYVERLDRLLAERGR
jgi:oligoendopeptidase F